MAIGSMAHMVAARPVYVNGVEGIKAATLPPPGTYWRMYNVYYSADEMMDDSGDKQDIGFDLKIYTFINQII
jgi:hypothetical protein